MKTVTLATNPELKDDCDRLGETCWPEFMRNGDVVHWGSLFTDLAAFQLVIRENEETIAVGHTVPLQWDGEFASLPPTIENILESGQKLVTGGISPNVLCAVAALVSPSHRGRGLSRTVLEEMRKLGATLGMGSLIAPVRPTRKSMYPIIPLKEYVTWERDDGQPFDPWIRSHEALGARMLGVVDAMFSVTGSVTDWESWTNLKFPATGIYTIPDALHPITIDRDKDEGHYVEANVWMKHEIPNA